MWGENAFCKYAHESDSDIPITDESGSNPCSDKSPTDEASSGRLDIWCMDGPATDATDTDDLVNPYTDELGMWCIDEPLTLYRDDARMDEPISVLFGDNDISDCLLCSAC
jgi:hypothetical protein